MTTMAHRTISQSQAGHVELRDWVRIQRLYAFCRARAIERIIAAKETPEAVVRQQRALSVLETMYGKARQHDRIVTGCAVTYFRAQAMKDAQHPDFLGEWI
jgi:hypothetical protein